MSRYIDGESRDQSTLFPQRLDEYIGDENPVRAVDVFVDELDLMEIGFKKAKPASTGRPAYHPATMLKIYIYGYLNRIQSSRRLERECHRNVELIWLTGKLSPDFKTIADFRKDNGPAIQKVCSHFVMLCRQLKLLSQGDIAIDGSRFKAVNNRDKNLTDRKLKSRLEHLERGIGRYLDEMDRVDRENDPHAPHRVANLERKIETIRSHMKKLDVLGEKLDAAPDRQVSLTDPDARSMATTGRGTGMVGYNVQTAVDSENHLIVCHDVTNAASDRKQLVKMARQARDVLGRKELTVLADRGYFSSREIYECEQDGIKTLVPKPMTSNSKAAGRFDKRDFRYDADADEYICPAGERAIHRMRRFEDGLDVDVYWSSACPKCPIKGQCTTSSYRRVRRWKNEAVIEHMLERLSRTPDASKIRRQTVEHPYATLKARMGATHFLMKRLPNVSTEMSLHVLAYNLTRVLNILGTTPLIQAMKA
ncbi:MAG: IS1182 family transposase [Oceanococcus sp.]|nr:MAG: IS1182 family transposase [Oceanococcus sp.]